MSYHMSNHIYIWWIEREIYECKMEMVNFYFTQTLNAVVFGWNYAYVNYMEKGYE